MKTVIVAALVLLVVCQNEALKCYCGGLRQCSSTVETCTDPSSVCGSFIFYGGFPTRYSKGCTTPYTCDLLNQYGVAYARCCVQDLCNR